MCNRYNWLKIDSVSVDEKVVDISLSGKTTETESFIISEKINNHDILSLRYYDEICYDVDQENLIVTLPLDIVIDVKELLNKREMLENNDTTKTIAMMLFIIEESFDDTFNDISTTTIPQEYLITIEKLFNKFFQNNFNNLKRIDQIFNNGNIKHNGACTRSSAFHCIKCLKEKYLIEAQKLLFKLRT